MPFTVIYDANVLYPAPLRDLLIRLAQTSLVQARWTDEILDETFRNIVKDRPDLDPAKLERTRTLMNDAVRDCLVTGYASLVPGLNLPDADDRHVLAAAIKAGAQTIVTNNLRDFPDDALEEFDIRAVSADDFVLGLIEMNGGRVLRVIDEQRSDLRNAPTREGLFAVLERCGLAASVAELRLLADAT